MKCGHSVTVASDTSSIEEWFDSTSPLRVYPNFPSSEAMKFRKQHVKGWITPTSCEYYIGAGINNYLFGILGFVGNAGFNNLPKGNYDVCLRADTTPAEWKYSTELLLYVLKSKEVQQHLINKFNRQIDTAYSMCFSKHPVISRYRKFAELVKKEEKRINKPSAGKKEKTNARAKIARDLKTGKITKQRCEVCGRSDYVEAHHPDYSKPDQINWLCVDHHNEADGRDGTCYEIIGYDLGYLFQLGTWTLKEAKNRFVQKHGNTL